MVDLQQETIASLLLNGSLDAERVRDSQIVTDNLDTRLGCEVGPGLPVVLVERILDRHNGVLLNVAEVQLAELNTSDPLGRVGVGVLEVQIVLAFLVELGGRNVKSNLDLSLVTSLLDCLSE